MRRLVRRAIGLSGADWLALAVAAAALVRARIAFGRAPAQVLVRGLRERSDARPAAAPPTGAQAVRVDRLRWALGALGPRMPFRADCMVQVLAAERILVGRGLSPKFYLGVQNPEGQGFSAHVWLQVGDVVVTGGPVDRLSVMIGEGGA